MPLTRKDFRRGSVAHRAGLGQLVLYPASNASLYLNITTPATTVVVGAELLSSPLVVPNSGITFTYTEAVGNAAVWQVNVTGENHLGVEVSEKVTYNQAGGVAIQTKNAWRKVTSIKVLVATALDNADTYNVGILAGNASNRLKMGIPAKIKNADEIVGAMLAVPITGLGNDQVVENVNLDYQTWDSDTTIATGAIFFMQFMESSNSL